MIFRTLIDAVKFLAEFSMDSVKAWDGIWEAGGDESLDHVARGEVVSRDWSASIRITGNTGLIVQLSK